jgi:spermidine/putrescine transport system permease protein
MRKNRSWLVAASVADLLFLYAPIAILIIFSFNSSKLSARWQGFSLLWYAKLFSDEALLSSTLNSLIVATISTMLAAVLGVLTALALERRSFRGQAAFESLLLMPIVIPEIMMGVAMLLFFVMIGLPLSLLTMIIAHTIFNFPVVALIVRARLRKLDPRLEEAARDLGATPLESLRLVLLPLLLPAILASMLIVFALSIDDFVVTNFTAGTTTTFPLWIWGATRVGLPPQVNVMGTLIFMVGVLLAVVSSARGRRRSAA